MMVQIHRFGRISFFNDDYTALTVSPVYDDQLHRIKFQVFDYLLILASESHRH
jgi:hypothetical protein